MINTAQAPNRKKFDQYFTPRWATEALLHYEQIPKGALIGEPCAGAGHIVQALIANGYTTIASEIDPTVESDPGLEIVPGIDFLSPGGAALYGGVDWIVTNPPYSCKTGTAAQIFRRAIELAPNVAMLLRMGWLEACADRYDILPMLDRVLVIANPRVQFIGSGSSNPGQSVWCVYRRDCEDQPTRIEWMDPAICNRLRSRK